MHSLKPYTKSGAYLTTHPILKCIKFILLIGGRFSLHFLPSSAISDNNEWKSTTLSETGCATGTICYFTQVFYITSAVRLISLFHIAFLHCTFVLFVSLFHVLFIISSFVPMFIFLFLSYCVCSLRIKVQRLIIQTCSWIPACRVCVKDASWVNIRNQAL